MGGCLNGKEDRWAEEEAWSGGNQYVRNTWLCERECVHCRLSIPTHKP